MTSPEHLSCHMLPREYKLLGKTSMERAIAVMTTVMTDHAHNHVREAINWAMSKDITYEMNGEVTNLQLFKNEIARIDLIRGEDFRKTFPELAPLLDL